MRAKILSWISCLLFAFGPAIVLITVAGCDDEVANKVVQRQIAGNRGNLPTTEVEIGYNNVRIVTVTHEQHRYVIFFRSGTGTHAIHDPDCPCKISAR